MKGPLSTTGRFFFTGLTLIAFAANSLLCRMALGDDAIDPSTFTALRLTGGAVVLLPVFLRGAARDADARSSRGGSFASALALFTYAIAFSFAYVTLSTGTGALLLFGSVQVTMLGAAVAKGESITRTRWIGSAVAFSGLVFLVFPGLEAPSPSGAALMVVAGAAWGIYSLRGRGAHDPARMTAGNFLRAAPLALVPWVLGVTDFHLSERGAILALASGMVTSGLGYILWYRVLRDLSASQASIVQLLVPILAALAGIGVLREELTVRLALATALVVGGVAAAVTSHAKAR